MLSFVQNWFASKPCPIGVDFGSESLGLAQVQYNGQDHALFAAASCDVPAFARVDLESRLDFFSEAIHDLFPKGKFRGRHVVLSLPASMMFVHHLRLPKMDEAELKKAVRQQVAGKLPIDSSAALIRHLVAGEIHENLDQHLEVIVLAAMRAEVDKYLAVAARAKLDIVGMKVEPVALVDCFSHVHRRQVDADTVSLYVDLGASGTRITIAQGTKVLFVRSLDFGGNQYNQAIGAAAGVSVDDARLLRLKQSSSETFFAETRDKRNVSPPEEQPVHIDPQASVVDQACFAMTATLAEAISLCRRDHESTFPSKPVQRLIFVGGEARQRSRCQQIACELKLPAQIGDPMVRMARAGEIPIETGIDRRLPQPAWAVAIGLSFDAAPGLDVGLTDHSAHAAPRAQAGAAR